MTIRSNWLLLSFLPVTLFAQPKAQPCFFSEDFEGDDIPAGWDIGPLVERTDENGVPLGEQVPAWTIGNAAQANAGGYFEVPDMPIGNRFVMANDDAPPCPCDHSEVILVTPELDFSDRTNVALEFRVYHDMLFGGGEAIVEASPNGTDWYWVHSIPAMEGEWQQLTADMSGWNDPQVWIRFRWSDNGEWATGIAIDDVCLRERYTNDLSIERVSTGNDTIPPFTTGDQSLRYTMLPLEQAGEFSITAEVMNRGTGSMNDISIEAMIQLDGTDHGPFNSDPIGTLLPGERRTIVIGTGWVPTTIGEVIVNATVSATETDEDPIDNTASTTMQITGPGWDDGYSAMALDDGVQQGSIGGSEIFITGNRFEMIANGTPTGISAVLAPGTEIGTEIRAIIFDANMAVIDTSLRHTITQEDIDLGLGGGSIFLPFSDQEELPAGDVFAGVQRISGTGPVLIGQSGNGPIGAAFHMQGNTFDLSYPNAIPMVRLHFSDFGVSVAEADQASTFLQIRPVPVSDQGTLIFDLDRNSTVFYRIIDASGRSVIQRDLGKLPEGRHAIDLEVRSLSAGVYFLSLQQEEQILAIRFVIAE